MYKKIAIMMAAAYLTVLCGCQASPAAISSPAESSSPAVSPSAAVSSAPSSPAADPLVKSWSTQKIADGSTQALEAPEVTGVSSADRQITIRWSPVPGAAKYDISWGRADTVSSDPSFTFSTDESTWPNDMTGTNPVHLHISAMDDQGGYSASVDVGIELYTGTVTFAFYDINHKDVKVGEQAADTVFPAGTQTFSVTGNTISSGPLQLAVAPEGWAFQGEFAFETEPIVPEQDNIVSIFVTKQ